ncbi:hypothetical protein C8258_23645 [Nocardia sp. MDA0666]|nr:hypothetical protein C8258_23645 [Nocardia sp. MDA0666]
MRRGAASGTGVAELRKRRRAPSGPGEPDAANTANRTPPSRRGEHRRTGLENTDGHGVSHPVGIDKLGKADQL